MNLYLILVTFTIVNARFAIDTYCDGVIIDGHYHERETLKTGLDRPFRLAIDYNKNIIYFSYINNKRIYGSALLDLNTSTKTYIDNFKVINDVPGGYTQAVDQNTHDVYIGGDSGIYKYDHKQHKSTLYAAKNKSINSLFFKDILYFSEWPSQLMYTYIDGNIARFKDMEDTTVRQFVIDSEDVMFHCNDTGLYAQMKGSKDLYLYCNQSVSGLTLDVHGNAYMCTSDGIYKIDKMRMSLKKLVCVNNCRGLAFDRDNNIIYADLTSLVRFKKTTMTC